MELSAFEVYASERSAFELSAFELSFVLQFVFIVLLLKFLLVLWSF